MCTESIAAILPQVFGEPKSRLITPYRMPTIAMFNAAYSYFVLWGYESGAMNVHLG